MTNDVQCYGLTVVHNHEVTACARSLHGGEPTKARSTLQCLAGIDIVHPLSQHCYAGKNPGLEAAILPKEDFFGISLHCLVRSLYHQKKPLDLCHISTRGLCCIAMQHSLSTRGSVVQSQGQSHSSVLVSVEPNTIY